MKRKPLRSFGSIGFFSIFLLGGIANAQTTKPQDGGEARLEALRQEIAEQNRQLEALKRSLAEQEAALNDLRRSIGKDSLAAHRGGTGNGSGSPEPVAQATQQNAKPVGQEPEKKGRAPDIAIMDQPGVLTPKGKFVLEPSMQYAYSSSNRVALVGYTIIPAILIGVIDVREVKRNTFIGALTGRYGITNRFEIEAKVPYVYRSDASVGREVLSGATSNSAFETSGKGVGDIELTARYQLNDGGMEKPYYVGSLRYKSRTGKDPFEIQTSNTINGISLREGAQTELPTGSGFQSLQPALTVLYPSDPAVFFGNVSYLHNFKRSNVTRNTDTGPQDLGSIEPGDIMGFNFGMGVALNEKSSFSIGYDHSSVGKTKQNGQTLADSVRVQLGTLQFGYSYRMNSKQTLNVAVGVGVTRDTPDVTLTVRLPISF